MDPRSTVTRWINTRVDELIEKEMSSGTDVKHNDFKASIETFLSQMKAIKEEVNKSVKSAWQKVAEIYEVTHIESVLVFEIDDKPIPGVNTLTSTSIRLSTQDISIALSDTESSRKKRCSASFYFSKEKSNTEAAIILANSFEKSAIKLTNTFSTSKSQPTMTPQQSFTLNSLSIAPTNLTTIAINGN